MSRRKHRTVVPEAKNAIDQMKYEIASVAQSGQTLAHLSGSVGGEITKRLVELGEQQLQKNKDT